MKRNAQEKTPVPKWTVKKIATWVGLAVVYVFVFYLGNISGEYIAARAPFFSFNLPKLVSSLPKISLPKISVSWNLPKIAVSTPKSSPQASSTTVVIQNNIVTIPAGDVTDLEKEAFAATLKKYAVATTQVTVNGACVVAPQVVSVQKGSVLTVRSTSSNAHTFMFGAQPSKTIEAYKMDTVTVSETVGSYPISCDGSIVGFYTVQ
jgi:hypothetical protein